jgi:hypothetical protein
VAEHSVRYAFNEGKAHEASPGEGHSGLNDAHVLGVGDEFEAIGPIENIESGLEGEAVRIPETGVGDEQAALLQACQ